MLTKKDFNAVAEIIKQQIKFAEVFTGQDFTIRCCRVIAEDLADYFATQNPRFDRDRFMKACGLKSNKEDQCNHCETCTNMPKNNKCPLFKNE